MSWDQGPGLSLAVCYGRRVELHNTLEWTRTPGYTLTVGSESEAAPARDPLRRRSPPGGEVVLAGGGGVGAVGLGDGSDTVGADDAPRPDGVFASRSSRRCSSSSPRSDCTERAGAQGRWVSRESNRRSAHRYREGQSSGLPVDQPLSLTSQPSSQQSSR